ncbi:D-aminoacylase [Talaromyces pinophilus]|uniref:D-aminoacylase n=1 Tax=Talaromyces pinophilus TaxID=128442 RepID=A0A478ECK5_TALPI|nr:D-aminoacylase [Talaromyces pinophilus]
MDTFEEYIQRATASGPDRKLPGAVLIVTNKDGIVYSKSFGSMSMDPASDLSTTPLTPDTTMWIASCTKLMTAIASMHILPEWKNPQILVGFEDDSGKPILKDAKNKLTLRMLLTHQTGLGYGFSHPELARYCKYANIPTIGEKRIVWIRRSAWTYGVGLDWAGQMIERVTNKTLGSFMEENIWKPLEMNSTTFRLQERPDIISRRADMSMRSADGTIGPSPTRFFPDSAIDDQGGGGIFSCPADYAKLLISILKNDGTLLKPSTMEDIFTPCLTPDGISSLRENRAAGYNTFRESKAGSEATKQLIPQYEMNYSVGGQISEKGWLNGRKDGSMSWGGLPNLMWVVDRETGIAFFYASQLLPPGDAISRAAFERFEYAIYNGELGDLGPKAS